MSEPSPSDFLSDPLTDVTRKERRSLLIASTIGFLVATMGLVPEKLSALEIEFSTLQQKSFVTLVSVLIVYFLVAFVVYATADFFVWRKKYQDYLVASEIASRNWDQADQERYDELHMHVPHAIWLYSWSKPVALVRIVFDFAIPVLIGVASVYSLQT